jgi:hypothetical protein
VIVGKIKSCTKDGVTVTLGFYDQIFIPSNNLQHPARLVNFFVLLSYFSYKTLGCWRIVSFILELI